jgi:hypothetical protein
MNVWQADAKGVRPPLLQGPMSPGHGESRPPLWRGNRLSPAMMWGGHARYRTADLCRVKAALSH